MKTVQSNKADKPLVSSMIHSGSYKLLQVAGISTPQDEKDPLFDHRAVVLPLNQELVDKLVKAKAKTTQGVFPPVEVFDRKDQGRFILDGRERWRAVEAASTQLGWEIAMEWVEYSGPSDDETLFLKSRERNGGRQEDSPLMVAKNAARAKELYGTTLAKFAAASGITTQYMKMLSRLLRLVPVLQGKIQTGELPASVGFQLAMLPEAEQVPGYNKLVDSNQLTVMGAKRLKVESQEEAGESSESSESEEAGESSESQEKEETPKEEKKNNQPSGWLGLTLSECRKLYDTTEARTCPLSDSTLSVLACILGKRPLEEAPTDLQAAISMLRAGTLPKKEKPAPTPKEKKTLTPEEKAARKEARKQRKAGKTQPAE